MSDATRHVVKLPDVGEGVAEAELVAWQVTVGDAVTPDTVVAEVLTDKATVEIYPPVAGVVAELHGQPGDVLAVGSVLVTLTTTGDHSGGGAAEPPDSAAPAPPTPAAPPPPNPDPAPPPPDTERPTASPAVRARATALGVDLAGIRGTGPQGQVTHADLDRVLVGGGREFAARHASGDPVRVEQIRGLRRTISERLTATWSEVPHITYVDSVDTTQLEALRATLNADRRADERLTLLPFLMRAVVLAVADHPNVNAHFDGTELRVHRAVHLGIATQTPAGLSVPVVADAGSRSLDGLAADLARVSTAARDGTASRDELSGSTITITSLGALGGLMSTPLLNRPEVAIVGVNKMEVRPVWSDGGFQPRQMFNLSSSFDHRVIDGWDAALFVQRIRQLLEVPALLFTEN